MAKVTIFVWYDITGEIVAIGRPMGEGKAVPLTAENQAVLETEIEEEDIAGLPQTHIVDGSRKLLVKWDTAQQTGA